MSKKDIRMTPTPAPAISVPDGLTSLMTTVLTIHVSMSLKQEETSQRIKVQYTVLVF